MGNGIYFWENNLERAHQYAIQDSQRAASNVKTPFVVGAVIELGNCLDLLDQKYTDFLRVVYQQLKDDLETEDKSLPANKPLGKSDFDFKARELDCAVIRYACALAKDAGQPFDSVRAGDSAGWRNHSANLGGQFVDPEAIMHSADNSQDLSRVFLILGPWSRAVSTHFLSCRNRKVIDKLLSAGVHFPEPEKTKMTLHSVFSGKTVVLTGALGMSRSEAKNYCNHKARK